MGEAAAGGFTQAGSIVRLKFTNFMQVPLFSILLLHCKMVLRSSWFY